MENNTPTFTPLSLPASGRVAVVDDRGREVAIRQSHVSAAAVANNLTRAAREGRLAEAFVSLRGSR